MPLSSSSLPASSPFLSLLLLPRQQPHSAIWSPWSSPPSATPRVPRQQRDSFHLRKPVIMDDFREGDAMQQDLEFEAQTQEAIKGTQTVYEFEEYVNKWEENDQEAVDPAKAKLALKRKVPIPPNTHQFLFGEGYKLMASGNQEVPSRLKMTVRAQLHQQGMKDAKVELHQRGNLIRGVDVWYDADRKAQPESVHLSYAQEPITYEDSGIDFTSGLEIFMMENVNTASVRHKATFTAFIQDQLNNARLNLCGLWMEKQSFRGFINTSAQYTGVVIGAAFPRPRKPEESELPAPLLPGFLRLPFDGNGVYVKYIKRPFWCPVCTWRAKEPHAVQPSCRKTQACRNAQAGIRRFNRRFARDKLNFMEGPPPPRGSSVGPQLNDTIDNRPIRRRRPPSSGRASRAPIMPPSTIEDEDQEDARSGVVVRRTPYPVAPPARQASHIHR
ncbi:hypothetical protein IE81DRAFT_325908 [Ceraceosorus guamensis]|uniref:Uncharacterized protein n=1 Tax=Ceraceosorus guamensis TaxID=1522189 RepID=A0A316VX94_9BASI|nr:hypothetical protein IE81DRAFT_325908 [Ceraceosorus guamensis]PWN40105.1 hypothetical protein IE81DRAFT_325908 [Ceraceosorus guamensis]